MVHFQTIDWVQRIEDDFFPVIAGELGSSMENCKHYEKQLNDFQPTVKVCVINAVLLIYRLLIG